MDKRITALFFAGLAASVAACGGGGGGYSPPSTGGGGGGGSSGTPPPPVQTNTVGIALPAGMGTVNTAFGTVGGYTQSTYSQVLAFAPGTKVTIKNLGTTTPHTLNVLSMSSFPANPSLSSSAAGGSSLAMGWQSGAIAPGGTVTVTLATAGTYFIGCAFHYASNAMRDILVVSANATPGPQATPQPVSSGGGGGGSGCGGVYC